MHLLYKPHTQLLLSPYLAHALCANTFSQLHKRLWSSCHSDYGGGGSDRGWGFPYRINRYVSVPCLDKILHMLGDPFSDDRHSIPSECVAGREEIFHPVVWRRLCVDDITLDEIKWPPIVTEQSIEVVLLLIPRLGIAAVSCDSANLCLINNGSSEKYKAHQCSVNMVPTNGTPKKI